MRFSHRLLWHALGLAFASTQCSALSLENLHFEFPNAMYTVQQNGESYRVALKDYNQDDDWGDPMGGNPTFVFQMNPEELACIDFVTPYSDPSKNLFREDDPAIIMSAMAPQLLLQKANLEGVRYYATGLTSTVYANHELSAQEFYDQSMGLVWFSAQASIYDEDYPGQMPFAHYSRRANALTLADSLAIGPSARLRFGQMTEADLNGNASLIFGQNGFLIVNLDDQNRLRVKRGATVKFNEGSGVFLYTVEPSTLFDEGDIKLFDWEEGAQILGVDNITLTARPSDDSDGLFFGHVTVKGNTLWATPHPWTAYGPYAELATALHTYALSANSSNTQHQLRSALITPNMWTIELEEMSLKGISLGTQLAMRRSLGFSAQDFMTTFGEEVMRYALVGKGNPLKNELKGPKVKFENGLLVEEPEESGFKRPTIPSFNQPVQVSIFGGKARTDGYTVEDGQMVRYSTDIQRESTGLELSIDRDYESGMKRWGVRLAYSNSAIRLVNRSSSDLPWAGDSDMVTARGYWAVAENVPNRWWVLSAGASVANDMVDVPYPFFKVESDDITRTMMQVGLARLDSSTELLPQTQLWSKLGGSLLWEKGAKYNIKVNGEDFFAVKEKNTTPGALRRCGWVSDASSHRRGKLCADPQNSTGRLCLRGLSRYPAHFERERGFGLDTRTNPCSL